MSRDRVPKKGFRQKRNIKNKKYIVREYSEEFLTGLYANLDTNLL